MLRVDAANIIFTRRYSLTIILKYNSDIELKFPIDKFLKSSIRDISQTNSNSYNNYKIKS